jgi:hypothetical protein
MDACCKRLSALVGEEETTTTLCEVFDGKQSHTADEQPSSPEKEMER